MRNIIESWVEEFEKRYPTRTIGNHHYIRRRHLEQFMYSFADSLVNNMFHDKQWFLDHIGKTIYRKTKLNCCATCTHVENKGLTVNDQEHADYLFLCQNEMGLIYTDKI